jgi:hypothetical protein
MVVAGDLRSDEPAEGRLAGFRRVTADGRLVDLTGDDEQERLMRRPECRLDAGRIEEAEGSVQRFAEGPVVVVVDFSRVQDDAHPQLMLPLAGIGEPGRCSRSGAG